MNRIKDISKKVLTNPAIIYVGSRYATYAIQFINSLFIAIYLGPFYLGIWGFIQLVTQYISQINFGIPHAVNVLVAIDKYKEEYTRKVIGSGILMLVFLSFLLVLFFVIGDLFNINIGTRYDFQQYIIAVCIIGVINYFNVFFSNIFRIYGKVLTIAITQSLFPVLMLTVIFVFKGESLLLAMVWVNVLSLVISFFIYVLTRPVSLKPAFDWGVVRKIQITGWHLFIYNSCFVIILLSTRTFISVYYEVEEFGFFTFSFSLAQTVLLFLQALAFLITPKLIHRFANLNNDHSYRILKTICNAYITVAHGLVYVIILLFPSFLYFFPKYNSVFPTFALIVLSIALHTSAFGYGSLLLARRQEKLMGRISLLALVVNILLALLLILVLQVTYEYVIIATMVSYFILVILIGIYGQKELSLHASIRVFTADVIPLRIMLPFLVCMVLIMLQGTQILFIIPLMLYAILNYKSILQIKDIAKRVLIDKRFLNI